MTTSTVAITLTTSAYVTNPAGSTVVTTGPAVVNPTYAAGTIQSFANFGTLDSTGNTNSDQSSGIFLTIGDAPGKASGIGNAGLITGYDYGIFLAAHNVSSNSVGVFNVGTIIARASSADIAAHTLRSAGIYAGVNATVSISNDGLIEGGEGIWLLTNDAGTQVVINDVGARIIGTAIESGIIYGIKIQDNNNGLVGTGDINNAGYIKGLVDDAAKYINIVNQSTGTINGGIFALGTGTLSLVAGETLIGGANFRDGTNEGLTLGLSTIDLNGSASTVGELTDPGAYQGFGFVTIAQGSTWVIGTSTATAGISGVTQIADYGTIDVAGGLAGNTINMEGSVAGLVTEVDFTGNNSSTPMTDYGAGDQIVFSTLAGGAGTSYQDSYNTATGVLTIKEINAGGTVIGSATATVSGVPGQPSLTSGSFVDINGPGGETVVLGSSTLSGSIASQGSIYLDYGSSDTLTNSGHVDNLPVTFGNHQSSLGVLNTFEINGTDGAISPYGGAISGFGLNDDIVIGPSTIPSFVSGDQVSLSYAGSILSVAEVNSAGTTIGSTTINVGTGYAANSFVALIGTNGINIETPATVDEQSFTFSASGTGNFENPADYVGGLAPGSSIVAGETVVIEAGTATVSSPLSDSGTILVTGSSADFVDLNSLGGGGAVDLAAGGRATLTITSSLSSVNMAGNSAHTTLDLTGSFLGSQHVSIIGAITNFGTTDSIILTGFTAISGDQLVTFYNTTTGAFSLSEFNPNTNAQDESVLITVSGPGGLPLTGPNFAESFGSNGLVITDMPCFGAGTRILTPDGQVKVEDLAEGDSVLSARDGAEKKIVWVGRRTIDLARHAIPEKVIPVVILAGAFGPGVPERDVTLSPDHALFMAGVLIEAKTLVNGSTVIRDRMARFVTYHHIELARHDVVLAEGLPAETYLDSGNRRNFEQGAAPLLLHPDFAAASRNGACAPLAVKGNAVRTAREALLRRARMLGFVETAAVDLTVKAGAARIAPQAGGNAHELAFALPAGTREVTLLSSTGVPAEIAADPSDRRALGVAVTGLRLIAGGVTAEIAVDDPAHAGFYAPEPGHRWTGGEARINLPAYEGEAVLVVRIHGQAARWIEGSRQGRISR
jgi:hypothetical protein